MGRPKKDPNREPTDQRILRAAEAAFGPLGYHGANLADIAAEAGVRRPTLLYYFNSKSELYAAVVRRGFEGLTRAAMDGMAKGDGFDEQLAGVIGDLVDFSVAHFPLLQILARELIEPSPESAVVSERLAGLVDALERFVRTQGGKRVRPDVPLRSAILQLISGFLLAACGREANPELWGELPPTLTLARALLLTG